jgi:uncharacterized protein
MAIYLGIHTETDVEIEMRDGTILRANIFRPKGAGTFSGLLSRTPYGKSKEGLDRFVRAGYAVVAQDSRGRYASDGKWVPFTVEDTGDAEDGYDTVEWLAGQPWCDGSVGTFGSSYNAWMQWQLAKLRPPHLKAMAAFTIPLELTEVDYSGGFRPGRRIRWWMTSMAPDLRKRAGMPSPHTTIEANRIWNELEHGRWLGLRPWMDIVKYLPPGLAEYAEDWLKEPHRRAWKFDEIHSEIEVPNLDFSGYYDHCNGTMAHLGLMQKNARTSPAREQSKLVIGPWNHGGLGKRKIGEFDNGPEADVDLQETMIRWFDYWLKDQKNDIDKEPPVRYFVMGSQEWKSASTWPPDDLATREYFLVEDGGLLIEQPKTDSNESTDSFIYDPVDPVPTLWTRDLFTVPSDRRQLSHRTDILVYRTKPLAEPAEVTGYPEVILFASTTAADTDFFARLIDEYPDDGPALETCYGMVRARHRNGLDREELVQPGQIVEYKMRLGATSCCFLPGHRIRLEIMSSDFPNHDRNHNTGKNDITDAELQVAEQTIYRDSVRPSRLVVRGEFGELPN